jgi:LacI family transcriptional regulator
MRNYVKVGGYMNKVNIKHVAKEAGVSIATVSRVVNGQDRVNKATIEKVLRAVETLSYFPDHTAQSMIKKTTRSIGLIVPQLSNEYWAILSEVIQDELWQRGFTLIICSTDHQLEKEIAYLRMMVERRVDGIILGSSVLSLRKNINFSHIDDVKKYSIPLVSLDLQIPGVSCVFGDHLQGAFDAVNHIIQLGKRKIAYIGGPAVSIERELGYRKAMMLNGLKVNESLVVLENAQSSDFGRSAVEKLIEAGNSFDAVFCGNDLIALGAMKEMEKNGLQVPKDVAVVGYDDITLAGLVRPSLTTVRQPIRRMGQELIHLLLDQEHIQDGSVMTSKKVLIPTEFIIRESCGTV